MKGRIFAIFFGFFILLCTANSSNAACSVCNAGNCASCNIGPWEWSGDFIGHAKVCCCENKYEVTSEQAHTGGTATCQTKPTCSVCKHTYGSKAAHSYTVATSCNNIKKCQWCTKTSGSHQKQSWWSYGEKYHWKYCTGCTKTYDSDDHDGGTATCQAKAKCSTCKQEYGSKADHVYEKDTNCSHIKQCKWCNSTTGNHKQSSSYSTNETHHWIVCSGGCGTKMVSEQRHGGAATCIAKPKCPTCQREYGAKLGHDMIEATCTTPRKCNRCSYTEGVALGHSWQWISNSHTKRCTRTGCTVTESHTENFVYLDDYTERCNVTDSAIGRCPVTREHSLSGWKSNELEHWQTCSSCSSGDFFRGGHSVGTKGTAATCLDKAICGVCNARFGEPLGHKGGSATCKELKKCERCGQSYDNYEPHKYENTCSEEHCNVKLCKWCNRHESACKGGCVVVSCVHCKASYCKIATETRTSCKTSRPPHIPYETCPHTGDASCSDAHCAGIRWCSYCESHTHTPCNTNRECPEPHCYKGTCSVCYKNHQGECFVGHRCSWVTNTNDKETQTHSNKCYIDNCDYVSESHDAIWESADANHTSKCSKCTLTYTHKPEYWSKEQRNATEAHPCAWHKGCAATHGPSWGDWFKVNTGKGNEDTDGGPHTRRCNTCQITEKYHEYSDEPWIWKETTNHVRECKVCKLKQIQGHYFAKFSPKDEDGTNHSELYKHWKVCTTCDPNLAHKEVDGLHEDRGDGVCKNCNQILWKAIEVKDGEDITHQIQDEVSSRQREATREEKIKIVEVVDNNGTPKIQYIQKLQGENEEITATSDILSIIRNGKYDFTTGRGGKVTIIILNISREILIDKIIDPITSTTGTVTIIIRTNKAEEQYNKKIYIQEGNSQITDSQLKNGTNPFEITKYVDKNGEYYFTARDTAGNTEEIKVVIDNIIKGQTTVAISNDVFIRGYVFTEVLVNPNISWSESGNASEIIRGKVYESENTTGTYLGNDDIKIVKVMDMQRNEVKRQGSSYLPGAYYIQVALGGKVFDEAGTYIVDLENAILPGGANLAGKNRIIVEVQDLKDLT